MRETRSVSDLILYTQIAAMTRLREAGRDLQRRVADEKGQTPTEYLMIVGLMAMIIVIVFVFYYWEQVKVAANTWVKKVQEAITGQPVQK